MAQNKNLVLIMGPPNTGKSTSLRNLKQDSMVYLNTDLKEIPFKDKFLSNVEVADALHVLSYVQDIEANPAVSGAVLDTLTFLMGMYERQYVANSPNGLKAWGEYGNFYRDLIHAIKSGTKDYAILAHEDVNLDEQAGIMVSKVPVKGSVGKIGVNSICPIMQ